MNTEYLVTQKWKQVKYIINVYAAEQSGTYSFKGFPCPVAPNE